MKYVLLRYFLGFRIPGLDICLMWIIDKYDLCFIEDSEYVDYIAIVYEYLYYEYNAY